MNSFMMGKYLSDIFLTPCSPAGHFSWEKYLKETGAVAAPGSCFKQVSSFNCLCKLKLVI